MDRRRFLKILSGAATAVAASKAIPWDGYIPHGLSEIDPEQALWTPGAKTIFLPPEKPLIVAPEKPQIFNATTIDLDRAMRDPAYFMSHVIGEELLLGESQEALYREYMAKHPPRPSRFQRGYLA